MFQKNCVIYLLLFYLIAFSSQEQNNWTIYNNSITINNYKSNLTDEQRESYYYWIGLRNSFYYSRDTNQLEKLVKYFTPEDENYYKSIFHFSIPGFVLTGISQGIIDAPYLLDTAAVLSVQLLGTTNILYKSFG